MITYICIYIIQVSPPQDGVPNPDGICTVEGFPYTRLGIRVPTIAVSPWIQKGVLVHEAPDAQKPMSTSQYEHSSIPATLRKIFPQLGGPLTARDGWAATFEHLFTDTIRTDMPRTLPSLPPPAEGEMERQLNLSVDDHALGLMRILCELNEGHEAPEARALHEKGQECGAGLETYHTFGPWVVAMWEQWRATIG